MTAQMDGGGAQMLPTAAGSPRGTPLTSSQHALLREPEGCGAGPSVISTGTSETRRALQDPWARPERGRGPSQVWWGEKSKRQLVCQIQTLFVMKW